MVLVEGLAFQAQDTLRGPRIDLNLSKHEALAVFFKRDVLVLDQSLHVRSPQVEVARHFLEIESPVRHSRSEVILGLARPKVNGH